MAGSKKTKLSVGGIVLVALAALANHFFGGGTPAEAAQPPASAVAAPATVASGPGFTSARSLEQHFEKHGAEFGLKSAAEYLALAQQVRDRPLGPTLLEETRKDGVTTRFDRESGAFLAFNRDRTIRTLFRPNDGERYFRRQLTRDH